MHINYLVVYYLLYSVYAKIENQFILDYFVYKNISTVVGFSCNHLEDNVVLLKNFNKVGIKGALMNLNENLQIYSLGNTVFWKIGIFLDTRCYDEDIIISFFLDASDYRMYDELHFWLILGSDLSNVVQLLDDRSFGISTDFVIAIPSDTSNYQLYDVYNVFKDRGTALNITSLGTWNRMDGMIIKLKQSKLMRRSNLHRLLLKGVSYKGLYRPDGRKLEDYFINHTNEFNTDAISKFSYYILKHLSDLYNFTLEIIPSPDWKVGDSLGPLVRTILNNSADLTSSALTINVQRTYLIKFVHQDWPFRTCFIFRNPQPTNIKVYEILEPFANEAWIALLLFTIFCVIIFTIILYYDGVDQNILVISNAILLTIGAFMQQGTNMKIIRSSTRIAFFFILIFGLLIYNFYTACVVSARLNDPIYKINDSIAEFSKLKLNISSERIDYIEYFFRLPDVQKFYNNYWSKVPAEYKFMPAQLGIKLVQKGGFAYHGHPDNFYPYIDKTYNNREICELMEVHVGRFTLAAFAFHFNSTVIEMARVGLTKITEVGLRHRQLWRYTFKKPHCRKDILSASSLTIYEFSPHLLLLLIGTIFAIVICVIEMFVSNRHI